ncbi:hypothetical protein [Kallotenue papyrolyticum]|uniref:hypothetical protein n=1 Tax=Kallotenue papyrolyticum TaxID=1325125 RepID=UPI001267D410|nr:hypothetical protein [Kallotenue papyrolyticum]
MKTLLTQSDLDFLLSHIEEENLRDAILQAREVERSPKSEATDNKQYIVTLDSVQTEQVLDVLGDLLMVEGIDPNTSEPNHLGYYIERLIDLFNPHTKFG